MFTSSKQPMPLSANVTITLFGDHGDTGLHRLVESTTTDSPWCPGQVDVFIIEAVHLGKLHQVVVDHDDSGRHYVLYL